MKRDMKRTNGSGRSTAGTILYVVLGPITWAAHFSVLYFSQSMLCAHSEGESLVPAIIGVATVVALVPLGAAVIAPRSIARWAGALGPTEEESRFHARLMTTLALLSAAAILWAGLTVFLIPSCLPLR